MICYKYFGGDVFIVIKKILMMEPIQMILLKLPRMKKTLKLKIEKP
jgi:hypothetical protein